MHTSERAPASNTFLRLSENVSSGCAGTAAALTTVAYCSEGRMCRVRLRMVCVLPESATLPLMAVHALREGLTCCIAIEPGRSLDLDDLDP